MPRFYIPDLPSQPQTITLPANEAAHARKVLRVQPGNEVHLFNGRGLRAGARIINVERKRVDLEVLQIEETRPPSVKITLLQAVTKPKSMDWIVEKATELGVHRIQPLLTENTVAKLDANESLRKRTKWQRTAIEALKQCGGGWLPHIESPQNLSAIEQCTADLQCQILASLSPQAGELRSRLGDLNVLAQTPSTLSVGVWIGPEGDFTKHETGMIVSAGAVPITLGKNVLRSETAAICAVSLIRYQMQLLLSRDGETV